MDFGICVASHIGDIDYVVRAEELGYSHAWLADSQMLWSDTYACLALAADRTSKINLGTGVAITGTRPAPVNAAGIATINALAPGRTFFGVGAGNTATRVMGQPPQRIKEFGTYLSEVVPLIRGEEAIWHHGEEETPIRHIMPDKGFVNFEDKVPVYVSGFGPKSLALAGQHGDGAVMAMPHDAGVMNLFWQWIEASDEVNRDDFYTTALTTIVLLEDDEEIISERVKSQCGAMAMASVHFAYDQYRNFGHQPPSYLHDIWEDYKALLETYPEERRHQRIHAGHNCWVLPEEEKFLTESVLGATCLIGTRHDVIDKLASLHEAGLNQVMILPNFDTRYEVIEDVGKQLIGAI